MVEHFINRQYFKITILFFYVRIIFFIKPYQQKPIDKNINLLINQKAHKKLSSKLPLILKAPPDVFWKDKIVNIETHWKIPVTDFPVRAKNETQKACLVSLVKNQSEASVDSQLCGRFIKKKT